jgi:GDP/UDP-N,N'-diacetylbacillosamine 2-epimerase (hydrolysing)
VMEGVREHVGLELQIVVTGMHLSPEYGSTFQEIERDGFYIDRRVETLLSSDTPCGVTKAVGLGVIGFADVFQELRPDVVVILGDRFEIFAAATAAMIARVPIAHLHGGETTSGVIDEPMRHAITKMASLHFVAAREYRDRVVQLGESPNRVFHVGGLGVDSVVRIPLIPRDQLELALGIKFNAKNLLITFHPLTLDATASIEQLDGLLAALSELSDTHLMFTMPNADTGGRELASRVQRFATAHADASFFTSLGQRRYLSCIGVVDAVVGNSSSGLIEAPALKTATINIGERQSGRLKASSVIDCTADQVAIARALSTLYSAEFQVQLHSVENPYGTGGASAKIVQALAAAELMGIVNKDFFDLKVR